MDSEILTNRCVHHRLCGDVIIAQHDPTFFLTHPPAEIGFEYQLCIKCGDLRYWSLYNQRPLEERLRGGEVPQRLTTKFEGYISIHEACEKAKIKENTMRCYARNGKITGRMETIGKKSYWYISIESLEKYMEESRDLRHFNRVQGSVGERAG